MGMTNANNKSIWTKGDTAYWVTMSLLSEENYTVRAYITPVRIESWGKKQGTFYRLDRNDMAKTSIQTESAQVFRTVEDAKEYIDSGVALQYSANRISGSLRCELSALQYVKPEYRAKISARIEKLENIQPYYEIILNN